MSQTYEEPGTALSVAQEPRSVAERPIAAPQLLDALRPAERVALMAEIATVVADVIEKQKWFKQIGPKKHILIQGWTFIGGLGGCSAKTVTTEKIEGGFKAHAVVVRVDSGIEVGSADQVCMASETNWRGKDDYALMGMASTRACSRALSTVFRHVVELAGYSATPAEEMIAESPRDTAAHPLQGRANSEPRGTAGGRGEAKTPPPARIPVAELQDQARSLGIADFRAWLVANVATDLATRGLRPAESVEAKRLLDLAQGAVMAAQDAEPERRIQPRTNGRLFAMLSERGMDEKHDRVVWAAEQGVVVTSFSELTEAQGRDLIRKLELIPPHDARDEEDALWDELEQQKRMGLL